MGVFFLFATTYITRSIERIEASIHSVSLIFCFIVWHGDLVLYDFDLFVLFFTLFCSYICSRISPSLPFLPADHDEVNVIAL